MPLEDCLGAAAECDAPMISICGGEPLIYPQIEALVNGILDQGRFVYICTNAMFMRKKMREYLAAERLRRPAQWTRRRKCFSPRNSSHPGMPRKSARARRIRKSPVIAPSNWMYWNVHLDGLERTHDLIVEREGVFKECILAIRMAKILGYGWRRTRRSIKRPT